MIVVHTNTQTDNTQPEKATTTKSAYEDHSEESRASIPSLLEAAFAVGGCPPDNTGLT
jgi:hypothetical protein